MSKPLLSVVIAGLLSSGLFLMVFAFGLGFVFMFLPTLPLFTVGLARDARQTLQAALIAAVALAFAANWASAVVFWLFLALPCWFMVRESLRSTNAGWVPIGLIVMYLALYACALVALVTLFYAGEPGGLPEMLSQHIHTAFAELENDYGDLLDDVATRMSFLIFSITVWMWGMALYAHGWLASRALAKRNALKRPDFAVHPFVMPGWMLSLLAICALASLIGSPQMSFLGKTALISLLLPYFFLGASLLHTASRNWSSRRFFLFFIYFLIFSQFWPALALSGIGVFHQIKHLSGGGSWFKS